jgi:xylulokinase
VTRRTLVAGVDSSTQSTKVLVVEAESGVPIATGWARHEVCTGGGRSEAKPTDWEQSLEEALALTHVAGRLAAISVAGQQHGLVCLGRDHRPLRPAILWNDVRSAPWRTQLIEELGGNSWWAQVVGSVPATSFTVSHWARIRQVEPALAAATSAIRLPHEYLTERLSGSAVTDQGDASGTGWWSAISSSYVPEVLQSELVALERSLLPEVLPPGASAGRVTGDAIDRFGLPRTCIVAQGTGDNIAAALGLALQPGQMAMSLGTSGTAFTVARSLRPDETGVVSGFADANGGFLPLICTLNCTLAIDRMASWLGIDREAVEEGGDVIVLPFLDGERTPALPEASGLIAGLRADTSRGQVLFAAYEGAVLSLLDGIELLATAAGGVDPDAGLLLIGGGARSPAWQRVVSSLSGRQLLIPEAEDAVMTTARGACVQAAAAWAGCSINQILDRWRPLVVTALDPRSDSVGRLLRLRSGRARLLEASLVRLDA